MLNKFVAWLMLSAAFIYPIQAHADLQSAFSNLMATSNSTSAGSFGSQTRHIFTGGGTDIHFPGGQMQLISASGPSFKAGCNGISFFFGGFSFINSEQFKTLVKQIASNAVGYAVQLAIKALCPQCDAVLSEMNKLAQQARKMAADSCALGKYAVDKLVGLSPELQSRVEGGSKTCAESAANTNASEGYFAAASTGVCAISNGLADVNKFLDDKYAELTPDQKKNGEGAKFLVGNTTWNAIKALGIGADDATGTSEREFLMSIIGTFITGGGSAGLPSGCAPTLQVSAEGQGMYCPPTLDSVAKAQALLMCGFDGSNSPVGSVSQAYCSIAERDYKLTAAGSELRLYKCKNTNDCLDMDMADGASSAFAKKGFLPLVENTLKGAVTAVTTGTAIDPDAIKLINTAPFPLYQAINIAAVYPSAADSLVSNMTRLTALLMAQEYLRRIVAGTGRTVRASAVNGQSIKDLRQALVDIEAQSSKNFEEVSKLYTLQEAITIQIKNVNKQIQTEVVSQGLIGNQMFVTGLMRNVINSKGATR